MLEIQRGSSVGRVFKGKAHAESVCCHESILFALSQGSPTSVRGMRRRLPLMKVD